MRATTFTPGLWRVSNIPQSVRVANTLIPCDEIVAAKDACWIAQVQRHRSCIATPDGLGNAHLIAAAPDLYAALSELLESPKTEDQRAEAELRGAAALAKARGEEI